MEPEYECTCEQNHCGNLNCAGECGCSGCFNLFADFGYDE
jgi:hypothetical protein